MNSGNLPLFQSNLPRIHNDPADRGAVAADVLGGRGDDDVGPIIDRPDQAQSRPCCRQSAARPRHWAIFARASKSGTSSLGLPIVSA